MSSFLKHLESEKIKTPDCHFVLGSGFSQSFEEVKSEFKEFKELKALSFKDVKGLATPSVASHVGAFRFFYNEKKKKTLSFQTGRLHLYEGHSEDMVVLPVMEARLAGVKNFVISNISGALKKEHKVGDVILLKDHVNMTGHSPLIGEEKKDLKGQLLGPRFPDMSKAYDEEKTNSLKKEMEKENLSVKKGVYVGVIGPEIETPSQISWLNTSSQGLFDVVGMSTVLEVIALCQSGARIVACSLISNPAAGVTDEEHDFKDILEVVKEPSKKILRSFFQFGNKI